MGVAKFARWNISPYCPVPFGNFVFTKIGEFAIAVAAVVPEIVTPFANLKVIGCNSVFTVLVDPGLVKGFAPTIAYEYFLPLEVNVLLQCGIVVDAAVTAASANAASPERTTNIGFPIGFSCAQDVATASPPNTNQ